MRYLVFLESCQVRCRDLRNDTSPRMMSFDKDKKYHLKELRPHARLAKVELIDGRAFLIDKNLIQVVDVVREPPKKTPTKKKNRAEKAITQKENKKPKFRRPDTAFTIWVNNFRKYGLTDIQAWL